MVSAIDYNFTDRQKQARALLDNDLTDQLLYGGAKGGGKSWFMCVMFFRYALKIIQDFQLKPRPGMPIPLGWLGRSKGKHFKDTTLQTWYKTIPIEYYRVNRAEQEIIILDTVKYDFGGLDSEDAINKFNSAEYAIVGIDQAEEVKKDDIAVLLASRRLTIDGKELPYKALYTANPAQCWLKDEFIVGSNPAKPFVQSLPSDNPHLPQAYADTLTDSFKHRPELLEAYLYGNWDALSSANQIILEAWINESTNLTMHRAAEPKRYLSCDPARFGDDETVIYRFIDTNITKQTIYGKISSDRLGNLLHVAALEHKATAIVIDEDGLGGPVVDWQRRLSAGRYSVLGIQSAAKAFDKDKYFNRRAEMWFKVAEMMQSSALPLNLYADSMSSEDWIKLKGQLCTPSYDFRGPKIIVEPKADIKTRLSGSSPDRADAAILGWSNFDRIPAAKRGGYGSGGYKRKRKKRSAMAA